MKIGKKIFLMLTAILLSTVIAVGVYVTSAYTFSTGELSKTFKDFSTSSKKSDAIKQTKTFSILLMGVDTGSSERTSQWEGNSDSMILVTINPKTRKTTMTSLERDILITLSGPEGNRMNGAEAKLNAAYAAGGAQMAIMTVQDLLNITIDNYVQINMQGLIDMVDAVGGITVTNHFDFPISISQNEPEYQASVAPGTHKINGEQALVYARMRYDDPEGDYGRQKRQREVIQKVLKKILALDSISSYRKILAAVSGNMQTNIEISSRTIPSLLAYTEALKHISTYQLKGEDATLADGGSYQIVTSDHLLEVQNRIRAELYLGKVTHLKTTATVYETLYGSSAPIPATSTYDQSVSVPTYRESVTQSPDYPREVSQDQQASTPSTNQAQELPIAPQSEGSAPAETPSGDSSAGASTSEAAS